MRQEDLDRAAELATSSISFTPRSFDCADTRLLLEPAYEGRRPS